MEMGLVRRLREVVGRYWERARPPYLNSIGTPEAMPLNDGEKLWNRLLEAGGCVECDHRPKGFIEGPSGGLCQNVFCSQCGQGYNLTPLINTAEYIHKDPRYIILEHGDAHSPKNSDGGRGPRPAIRTDR